MTIKPFRVVRTIVGIGIMAQAVFWTQPDTVTLAIKLAAGILLVDVTLFGAALQAFKALRGGNGA